MTASVVRKKSTLRSSTMWINSKLWMRFKVDCARTGETIASRLERLITEDLKRTQGAKSTRKQTLTQ